MQLAHTTCDDSEATAVVGQVNRIAAVEVFALDTASPRHAGESEIPAAKFRPSQEGGCRSVVKTSLTDERIVSYYFSHSHNTPSGNISLLFLLGSSDLEF